MTKVMQGIRVLEVAQHTFVPSAGGILADWGADVVKIEHPVRGDAMRGIVNLADRELILDATR
ncbi:CoA transferase [Novosphingobium sp. ST904]|uniref:CoA transferase n=1 Tax=Novosphingobium sp. ST904 TaxID=1684385 RepID=UPI000B2DEFF2